jgi:multiple antibiotic resistance protein
MSETLIKIIFKESTMEVELLKSFITLFIIIDPFISAAFFVGYCKNMKEEDQKKAIWTAILVAGILMYLFLFLGLFLLHILNISFNGFRVAGGIILLIMGITGVLGIDFVKKNDIKSAAILIGTPMLAGPGALTTITILSNDYGYFTTGFAAILVLIASYFILRAAPKMQKILGEEMIHVFSKVLGLLLSAIAVDFIYQGIRGFIGG